MTTGQAHTPDASIGGLSGIALEHNLIAPTFSGAHTPIIAWVLGVPVHRDCPDTLWFVLNQYDKTI